MMISKPQPDVRVGNQIGSSPVVALCDGEPHRSPEHHAISLPMAMPTRAIIGATPHPAVPHDQNTSAPTAQYLSASFVPPSWLRRCYPRSSKLLDIRNKSVCLGFRPSRHPSSASSLEVNERQSRHRQPQHAKSIRPLFLRGNRTAYFCKQRMATAARCFRPSCSLTSIPASAADSTNAVTVNSHDGGQASCPSTWVMGKALGFDCRLGNS
jgi:hypothetical protein